MNIRHNLEAARMASFSANEESAFVGKLLFCFDLMPNMNDFPRKSWLSCKVKACGFPFCFALKKCWTKFLIFLWVRGVAVGVVCCFGLSPRGGLV